MLNELRSAVKGSAWFVEGQVEKTLSMTRRFDASWIPRLTFSQNSVHRYCGGNGLGLASA
jgi:hypothetical protein